MKSKKYLFTNSQFYRFCTSFTFNVATPVELTLTALLDSEKYFNMRLPAESRAARSLPRLNFVVATAATHQVAAILTLRVNLADTTSGP